METTVNESSIGGLTLIDLQNIRRVLRLNLLPVQGTGLNYIINKNLLKLDKYLRDKEDLQASISEKYTVKDGNDIPILYAYYAGIKDPKDPNFGQYKLTDEGEYIVISKKDSEKIPATSRIDVLNPEYKKDMQDLQADIVFEFHKFPADKIKECMQKNLFDGIDYSPLIDHLFDDIDL